MVFTTDMAALSPAIGARLSAVRVVASAVLVALSALSAAAAEPEASSFVGRFAAVERGAPTEDPQPADLQAMRKPSDASASTAATSGAPLYRPMIEKEAAQAGLAPEIAEAVMAVESRYNPAAIGGAGEIGLMQILPSTARMLGFSGSTAELAAPETNIHFGVTYLAQAWLRAGGDLCTTVMKYRAGHGETRFSFLSVNYCLAVRSKLAARGFRVMGNVPVVNYFPSAGSKLTAGGFRLTGNAPAGATCGRKCLRIAQMGAVNIAALNTQLGALVVQVRAKR